MIADFDYLRCLSCSRQYWNDVPNCLRCGGVVFAECSRVWEKERPSDKELWDQAPGSLLGLSQDVKRARKRRKELRGLSWRKQARAWFNKGGAVPIEQMSPGEAERAPEGSGVEVNSSVLDLEEAGNAASATPAKEFP